MRTRKWFSLCGSAALSIALASTVAPAYSQGRGVRNQNDQQYQSDRGQFQTDRGNYHRFDDRDRRMFQSWYNSRRQNPPAGFRLNDRLPPDLNSRVGIGFRIGPEVAPYYRPIPYDLARRMPLPPRGYKYVMLGNRIVLLDNRNTVRDTFSFQFNF